MSFAQALIESVKTCPYTHKDGDRVAALRQVYRLPVDFYLGDLATQYPPSNFGELASLVNAVENTSKLTTQERVLCLFYVFQAYESTKDGKGLAEYYANELRMPISWQNYAKCLWAVDQGRNDTALEFLGVIPSPKPVIDSIIHHFEATPSVLCMFFETHRQYLDDDNLPLYIASLCHEHLYFAVCEILRTHELIQDEILGYLGEHAASLTEGSALEAFVSVPWLAHEWEVFKEYLDNVPESSPARKLSLVRALHLGDLATIQQYKEVPEFEVLTKTYDDY